MLPHSLKWDKQYDDEYHMMGRHMTKVCTESSGKIVFFKNLKGFATSPSFTVLLLLLLVVQRMVSQ